MIFWPRDQRLSFDDNGDDNDGVSDNVDHDDDDHSDNNDGDCWRWCRKADLTNKQKMSSLISESWVIKLKSMVNVFSSCHSNACLMAVAMETSDVTAPCLHTTNVTPSYKLISSSVAPTGPLCVRSVCKTPSTLLCRPTIAMFCLLWFTGCPIVVL